MKNGYRIKRSESMISCYKCGERRQGWNVIGPDKALIPGETFSSKYEAIVLANRLNEAYRLGYAARERLK